MTWCIPPATTEVRPIAYNDDIFRAQAEEWAAAIHNVNFQEDIALGCAAFVEAMADAEYAWHEGAPGPEDQQSILRRLHGAALVLVQELDKEMRA